MIPELILIALLIGWISGGKFERLADAKIRHGWLIFVPLGLYLFCRAPFANHNWFHAACAIAAQVTLLTVAACNLRIPGAKLILLGLVLNLIAIAANGGLMPVSLDAMVAAGARDTVQAAREAVHPPSAVLTATSELGFLCDVIAGKRPYFPGAFVCSVGDLVMSAGIFIAIIGLMRTPLPGEKKAPVGENSGA